MSDTYSTLTVPLSDGRDYPIHIGSGLLQQAGSLLAPLARGRRVVIVSQPPIAKRYAAPLSEALSAAGLEVHCALFPNGERHKTLRTVERLYRALYDLRVDRKTLIVALGGGVVGDVAGWVAASYLRGLDFVQVPTTLLAMVDSSVGGKTGVDYADGKNLIGAFYQPRAVLADIDTLRTLPARDLRSGLAEVVKYGVIREPELLSFLDDWVQQKKGDAHRAFTHIVLRSCAIKADVVAGDEREESGLRAILNFGHTVGHALEAATRYRRYRHGEAVAIGMVAAACIGEAAGVTPSFVTESVVRAVRAQRLPVAVPEDVPAEALTGLLTLDKKAEAGRARFVLARALGDVELRSDIEEQAITRGLALQVERYGVPAGVA